MVYMYNENLMRMPDVHVSIKGSHFAFHCRGGAANLRRCSILYVILHFMLNVWHVKAVKFNRFIVLSLHVVHEVQ